MQVHAPVGKVMVRMAACGDEHSLALLWSGSVLGWGSNMHGALGLSDEQLAERPVKLPFEETVCHVACGQHFSVVITTSGEAMRMGELFESETHEIYSVPVMIDVPDVIVKAACGTVHSLLLTARGDVLSFGQDSDCVLGHGAPRKDLPRPMVVEMQGKRCSEIACSARASFAMSSEGQLFAWGACEHGDLGLGQKCAVRDRPAIVEGLPFDKSRCSVM